MAANLTVRILDRIGRRGFTNFSPGLIELKHVPDASRVTDQSQSAPRCAEHQIKNGDTHNQLLGVNEHRVFMRITH